MWSFAALIALAFALWIYYRIRCFSVIKELNIPGPEPNIFFGNLLEMSKNPLECHKRWIKKYGKVMGYYLGKNPMILISDVNILKRIQITDFHKFINRPVIFEDRRQKNKEKKMVEGFSNSLIDLENRRWKEIRSILTPSFTSSKMKQMSPLMNNAINSLINNINKRCESGEEFDIYELYQGLTMDVVGRTAFGINIDVQNNPGDPFLRTARLIFSVNIENFLFILLVSFKSKILTWISTLSRTIANRGKDPLKELIGLVKGVIVARRKNKENHRPDLLQLLIDSQANNLDSVTSEQLTASDEKEVEVTKPAAGQNDVKSLKKLDDAEVLDNAFIFFLAAYETTSTALAFTTHLLIQHPEVQEKVRKEVLELLSSEGNLDYNGVNQLQYLDQVLKESLRLYPPFPLFVNRVCSQDVDFGDFQLKKGVFVQVAVYNLQRSPEFWEEPDEFRPERFAPENKAKINPIAYQPFGAGPRNCIGMRFALMEAKLALARILSKYYLKPCSKTETELTLRCRHSSIHPNCGVWLKVIPVQA